MMIVYFFLSLLLSSSVRADGIFGETKTVQDYIRMQKIIGSPSVTGLGSTSSSPAMLLANEQIKLQNEAPIEIISDVRNISTPDEIEKLSSKKRFDIYKINGQDIYFYNFKNETDFTIMESRMRAFIELPGKKLLNDYQLYNDNIAPQLNSDNGFDYSMKDIVHFLNNAEKSKIKLNPWELQLQSQLQKMNLIKRTTGQFVVVKEAALLALVKASRGTKDHELNHGIYFTDSTYRAQCDAIYESLSQNEKEIIRRFITPQEYDLNDKSLMAREVCACLRDWETLTRIYFDPKNQQENQLMAQLHRKVLSLDKFSKYYREHQAATPLPKKNSQGLR